jgi:NAD(P)-dependent dehydrogenase (short-subunit alcohol dehydrogenase family)
MAGDIGDWDFATSLVRRAVDEFGDLNVLVNNAGVLRDRMIFSISADEWDTVLRVHLRGHAATCQAATAYWRERNKATGESQWARVVNTASEAFLFGSPGQSNYSAAKAGIAALTLSVAHGAGRYGVRANALAPRARTAMTEATFPPPPDGDEVDPWAIEHVAPVVVWLGSRAADHVTGNVFVVYSGKVGVMKAPTLDGVFATEGETWTVDELDKTVGAFLGDGQRHGFAVGTDLKL